MAELVKFEVVDLPKTCLVGKASRFNSELHFKGINRIPAFWDRCLSDGTFAPLESKTDALYEPAYVGASMDWDMGYGTFTYICGMLFKEDVTVSEGYVMREFGGEKIAMCWIKGKNAADVTSAAHTLACQAIKNASLIPDQTKWSMELFNNPRFTKPDENGEIILDYYLPLARSFESLGKRILYPCLAVHPAFKPVTGCNAGEESQKQMYDFIYESIEAIEADLSIIDITFDPDDSYEFWQPSKAKPGLIEKMHKIRKSYFALFEAFIKIGLAGEPQRDSLFIRKADLKISKKIKDKLSAFGLTCEENKDGCILSHHKYKELFPAWKLHCTQSEDNKITPQDLVVFLYGLFSGKLHKAAEMFFRVSNAVLISELEQYFIEKGYSCKNDELKVSYEKEFPNKQKSHLNVFYDWRKVNPLVFEFKVPHFSQVIKFYDQMDTELKALVFHRTKICDGCGYCTQTDKTGKRPRLAIKLELDGETQPKCPLFPSFTWGKVSESMIGTVKKLFDFAESVL